LKIAKIHVNPRSLRKQISLFEIDDSQDVEFNGSKSASAYQEQLYTYYLPCKRLVDEMMNDSLDKADSIKREFDLFCFEIREFRHRFEHTIVFYLYDDNKRVTAAFPRNEFVEIIEHKDSTIDVVNYSIFNKLKHGKVGSGAIVENPRKLTP